MIMKNSKINIPSLYKTKVVTTNTVMQIYVYDKFITKSYDSERVNYQKSENGMKSNSSIQRAKTQLFNLVASNVSRYSKFITLTTKETVLDRNEFLNMFNQFRKNFSRVFGYNLKYVSVLERQKKRGIKENNSGSYHMHLIVFNDAKLPFESLKKCWCSYGSVDVKKLRDYTHIPLYLMKYLTKEIVSHNDKMILVSQKLKQPRIYYSSNRMTLESYDYRKEYFLPNGVKCIFYEIQINRSKSNFKQQIEMIKFD